MKLTVTFLLLTLGLTAEPVNVAKAGMDAERLAKIPARMKSFVEKETISGAVTLLQRHGELALLEAVGFQDAEAKIPMRTDTIFQIMSMTKPVTGVAIMILAEEGKLALNDPVEKHLPEFRGLWLIDTREGEERRTLKRPSRAITIRDLMTHTSGMTGGRGLEDRMYRPLAEVVAAYSQQPLEFEPGTRWLYSNTGLSALGRIVEVAADMPYEGFVEERIFRPLGMKDSHFFPPAEKHPRIAAVYKVEGGKRKRADVDLYRQGAKNPNPSGGMFSTAADMAAFYQMMLSGGTYNGKRILSKTSVQVMTANHTGTIPASFGAGLGFGLTWSVVREAMGTLALASPGTYSHGGAFGTYGWVDPRKDMLGVLMIQRESGAPADERQAFVAMAAAAITE